MLDIIKRLLRIGKVKADKGIEKMEDPVQLIELQLKDLKTALAESLRSLSEAKASYIRAKREAEQQLALGDDYEQKAILLLQRARNGELDSQQADLLASQALARKEGLVRTVQQNAQNIANYEAMVRKLEENTIQLRTQIDTWEQELRALKARAKISEASKKINEQLAGLDVQSTVSLMSRLKENVEQQEALAQAYSSVNNPQQSLDAEIERALGNTNTGGFSSEVNNRLNSIKQQLDSPKTSVNDEISEELRKLKDRLK